MVPAPATARSGPALALAVVVLWGLLAGCSAPAGASDVGPVLRIGSTVEPTSLDPAGTGTAPFMPFAQAVYDSLLARAPDGSLEPLLASRWEYSADQQTLTLALRGGITFSDGAPFDSAAVRANLLHFQDSPTPAGPLLRYVTAVETPDPRTVVLRLSAPDPALLVSLAGPAGMMGSPAAIAAGSIGRNPVGTGPYTLDREQTAVGAEYVFRRKPDYWGGPAPFSQIRFLIIPDETARLSALKSGQLDATLLLSSTNARDAESNGFRVLDDFGVWEGLFFFDRNGALAPELADRRVREALRIAIDAKTVVDKLYDGDGQPTSQIFDPADDAYDPELDERYAYDPERARRLLAEAGHGDGLTIDFPRTPSFDPALYVAIEQYWRAVGVRTTVKVWGPSEAIPSMQRGDYAVAFFRNILQDPWSTVNFSVGPKSRYNPFGSTDPTVTGLIARMQSGSAEARASAGRQLSRWLVDQVWFGPLYRPAQFFALSPRVDATMQRSQGVPSISSYRPVPS